MGHHSSKRLPQLQLAVLVTSTPTADRPIATHRCPMAAHKPLMDLLTLAGSQPFANKAAKQRCQVLLCSSGGQSYNRYEAASSEDRPDIMKVQLNF